MRVAVVSDIHSNLPALEAVLAAIEDAGVEEVWCLGDVVGYGAEPDACADLVRERCDLCLAGNHDLAVLGGLDIAAFSDTAAEAVRWTQANAAESTIEFLRELEPTGLREGVGLFHASPRDPVWEYVLSIEQADACLDVQPERVCLIGHSHVSLFFTRPGSGEGRARPGAPRPATGRCSTSAAAPGWSTPAASASRATATRAPPGWSSTPRRSRPASTASPTTSTAPPSRSPPPAFPNTSPTASTRGRERQLQGKSSLYVVL